MISKAAIIGVAIFATLVFTKASPPIDAAIIALGFIAIISDSR